MAVTAGLAFACQGCFEQRKLGISEVAYPPAHRTELACLSPNRGVMAELTEGEVASRPAVTLNGVVIGDSPTLIDVHEKDRAQIFVGQNCVVRYGVCDNYFVLKEGERRVAMHWARQYPPPAPLPTSTRELLEEQERRHLVQTLRAIDLDPPSHAAFLGLVKARRSAAIGRLVVMAAGAAAAGAGQARGPNVKAFDAGLDIMKLAQDIPVPGEEKELADKHPKLMPVFLSLGMMRDMSESRTVCVNAPK